MIVVEVQHEDHSQKDNAPLQTAKFSQNSSAEFTEKSSTKTKQTIRSKRTTPSASMT
jgi:hypothetical protein